MNYLIVESLRRLIQMIFGMEIFSFPGLMYIRKCMYRLCFHIGSKPTIDYGVKLSRSHRIKDRKITIGKNVLFSKHTEIDYSGSVNIGDYVWISEGMKIFTHNHSLTNTRCTKIKENVTTNELIIENNVWIGANSVILPTVNFIGENSVIGAGWIVTKNVDKNIVIAGNPAKFIKKVDI